MPDTFCHIVKNEPRLMLYLKENINHNQGLMRILR